MMFEECLINYLANLPDTHPAVLAFGTSFRPGENLFAFSELPRPHDLVWVVVYSRERQDMSDAGIQMVRCGINVRSFDYKKAAETVTALTEELNGKELLCDGFKVLFRGNPVASTPVYLDPLRRMVFLSEFICEVRYV